MKRKLSPSLLLALAIAAFSLTGCKGGIASALGKAQNQSVSPIHSIENSTVANLSGEEFVTSNTIASRENQICAIQSDDTVKCLGAPGKETFDIPARILSSGVWHTCFATKAGAGVICGSAHPAMVTPISPINTIPGEPTFVKALTVGAWHACSIDRHDEVTCWGDNSFSQIAVPNDLGKVTGFAAGFAHTCAIRADEGTVKCWGADNLGQVSASKGIHDARLIAAGKWNTCVVFGNHKVFCWGRWPTSKGATKSISSDLRVKAIAVGTSHACAISVDNSVDCFGSTEYGATEPPLGLKAKEISAGENHSCARTLGGDVVCWGSFGDSEYKRKPVTFSLDSENRIKAEGGEEL